MFTVNLRFRPLGEWDMQPVSQEFENREEALKHGMSSACMAGITNVTVYDERTPIASYNRTTNYWYEFKDANGKPVSWERFFELQRKKTEQRAISDGFNIRIRHQGMHWRVLAGERSLPIDQEMLPWVSEAIQEIEMKQDDREIDGDGSYSQKELLEMFMTYLQERISKGLKKNPACFSRLRWDKPFNDL